MTEATTPPALNPDKLAASIEHLQLRHRWEREELVTEMRALAEHLVREATLTEENARHYPNSLGVVQGRGRDLDRGCMLLWEKGAQLEFLRRIARGGTA